VAHIDGLDEAPRFQIVECQLEPHRGRGAAFALPCMFIVFCGILESGGESSIQEEREINRE
jgi:hypothetical protein